MMADELTLEILTPAGAIAQAAKIQVSGVEVPATKGELGILPAHIPLISSLEPGVVRTQVGGETRKWAVGTGFVEVAAGGSVTILVDRCRGPDDVDVAAVQEQLSTARTALETAGRASAASEEFRSCQREVRWLEAQLQLQAH